MDSVSREKAIAMLRARQKGNSVKKVTRNFGVSASLMLRAFKYYGLVFVKDSDLRKAKLHHNYHNSLTEDEVLEIRQKFFKELQEKKKEVSDQVDQEYRESRFYA